MMRNLLVLIGFLFVAGCTVHEPVKVALPVDLPDKYLGAVDQEIPVSLGGKWWLVFEDARLEQMMAELFNQNLELTQAIARLQQIEAIISISRSARLPNLSALGNASRSQQPGIAGDFIGDTEQYSLQAGFEVDLWGRLTALEKASQLDYSATRQDIQTLYLGLTARLADLYFLSVEQRAQIALADRLIASFADTAERVERRYRLGLAPALDMYQSRQSLSAAQATRHLYEARLAEAEHAISILLGRYPQQQQKHALAVLPVPPQIFAVDIPANLIKNRPDLRAALNKVDAADQRVAAAIADRFPAIRLSGSYGALRQEVTAGLLTGDFWSLLGNFALPLVDGGRRRAEVDRNQAVLREAVAVYQQKVLVAFRDVEDALANNYATAQRVDRLAETAQATGATLRLSTQRYLSGLADYLPVLTAQRADFETQSRLLAAQRQLLSDRISLARALGGAWMHDEMTTRLQIEKDDMQ